MVLEIIAQATEFLGAEKYVTCSCVLPLLSTIAKSLNVNDDDAGYIAHFKVAALNDFQSRVENMKSLDILKASTALDPRFKSLKSINKESREDVWKFLRCAVEQYCNKQTDADEQSGEDNSQSAELESSQKKPRLMLTCNDSESESEDDMTLGAIIDSELQKYRADQKIPESQDPLLWWKVNACRFPKLASFVPTVLCIPATSVPCERLFSTSGYIVNKLRASLTSDNVRKLVCLKDWSKLDSIWNE